MRRHLSLLLPVAAWAVLLFALSSRSDLPSIPAAYSDKLMHAVAYSALGWLSARAALGYGARPRDAWLYGSLIAAAYGATDEIHQIFIPNRSPDIRDWVADALGGTTGAFLRSRVLRGIPK